jgi:ribosome-associated toxin RatA of RatAB toxin-antitoxin module
MDKEIRERGIVMKIGPYLKVFILLVLSLELAICFSGCQKIKKIFVKPPPEGLVQESYSIRLVGYEQTVTVKASSEEIFEFVSDPANLGLRYLGIGEGKGPILAEKKPLELGGSLPVTMGMMGVGIKGRMIVVRTEKDRHWMVVENPFALVIQRWSFEPLKGETRLTVKMDFEIPEKGVAAQLGMLVDFADVAKKALAELDLAMARVQAHFDPALDAEELVAMGLRGETYETLFQVHEASVWINSSPENIIRKGLNPDNFRDILSTGKVEGLAECLYEPENRRKWEKGGSEEPIFCPMKINVAGYEWKADSFNIINPNASQEFCTTYGVLIGVVSRLQFVGEPEGGGTRLRITLVIEPPGSATPNLMDALVSLSGLPRWMERLLLDIKARVEGVG